MRVEWVSVTNELPLGYFIDVTEGWHGVSVCLQCVCVCVEGLLWYGKFDQLYLATALGLQAWESKNTWRTHFLLMTLNRYIIGMAYINLKWVPNTPESWSKTKKEHKLFCCGIFC